MRARPGPQPSTAPAKRIVAPLQRSAGRTLSPATKGSCYATGTLRRPMVKRHARARPRGPSV